MKKHTDEPKNNSSSNAYLGYDFIRFKLAKFGNKEIQLHNQDFTKTSGSNIYPEQYLGYIAGMMCFFISGLGRLIGQPPMHPVFSVFLRSFFPCFAYLQVLSALNIEDYAALEDPRASIESWIGSQIHLFNLGRLSFQNNLYSMVGSLKGRIRIDNQLDVKYGLPLSLYIRTGIRLNYDNQPVEESANLDYIWQTSFGWMFGR